MHREFLCKIAENYPKQFRIMEMRDWGEANLVVARVQSTKLPNGYNGQMELSVVDGQLRFKRDHDT